MNVISDLAFFVGFFFLIFIWYAQGRLNWKNTINLFGGESLANPKHGSMKHLALQNFTWGFAGLLFGWVALGLSQSMKYFPLVLSGAALVCFSIQTKKKLNKWAYAGFILAWLAIGSNVVFSF